MVQFDEDTDLQYECRSDHSMVFFFPPETLIWKKKINEKYSENLIVPSLLKYFAYLKEINEGIKYVIENYAVMFYDRKEIIVYQNRIFDLQYPISCSSMFY